MKIGLIGRGRLGKLIEHYLGQDTDLVIYEKELSQASPERKASLDEVCKCKIVIAAVPISALESLLHEIKDLLAPDTLFIDVCSVKETPLHLMKSILPNSVQLLGTHPMFGPDSAAKTLFGSKIVLCPVRVAPELYHNIKAYLETHGLKTIEVTPKEHDRQISSSLLITHLIGRTLMEFKATPLEIDTKGYRRLLKILEVVENDSWQLFVDMNRLNPQAEETKKRFINSLELVLKKLKDS